MKEVVFSKNAWGYRFLCFMNSNYKYSGRPQDICAYGRALLWQTIRVLFFVAATSLFSLAIGSISIDKIYCQVYEPACQVMTWSKWSQVPVLVALGLFTSVSAMAVITLFIVLAAYILDWASETIRGFIKSISSPSEAVKEPNTVVKAYKAWKEKSCYKIKFD